jgi:hypothetical protein
MPFGPVHRENARAVGDYATAAEDDASHGQAGLWILGQGRIAHALLYFETAGFLAGLGGNGFVNVGSHVWILLLLLYYVVAMSRFNPEAGAVAGRRMDGD